MLVLNENGELQTSKTFGGNKKDGFNAIMYSENNEQFYIGGYTNSDDGDINTPPQLTDTWLLAINNNDYNIAWENTWGGTSAEIIVDITALKNGNIAFTGETSSSDLPNFQGAFDIFCGVSNANGNLLWANTYGGSSADSPLAIIENTENNLAIISYSNSLGGDIGFGYQAFNIWLAEINAENGNLLENQILGGNRWDFGSTILPLEDGYFITGNTDSFDGDIVDGSGKKTTQKDGNHDIWIAKLSKITNNTTSIAPNLQVQLFPNPSQNFLHLKGNFKLAKIFNSSGQTMHIGNEKIINIKNWKSGVYIANFLLDNGKIVSLKFEKV